MTIKFLDKVRASKMDVDYRKMTTMPIRDMQQDGRIVFCVDVYGWTARDICVIPGGSDPMIYAVRRLGLDPERYQAVMQECNVLPSTGETT